MRQKNSRGAQLSANLPQLQNLIKRDPPSYREEFLQQWNHYESIRRIFQLKPDDEAQSQRFRELVGFISQVAQCYPNDTADFPTQLSTLLLENYAVLNPDTRKTLVQNLVMLRNKDVITSIQLLQSLFPLLPKTTSSTLRSFIRTTILSDIRTANSHTKNHKLNRAVQAMLFGMVERGMDADMQGDKGKVRGQNGDSGRPNGEEAMWAVMLTKELWKKGTWNDAKSVSIVALGCFHPVVKVQSASIHFFLGSEDEQEDSESEDEGPNIKNLQHKRTVTKKTRSGEKKMAKSIKVAKKKRQDKAKADHTSPNFPALQLLHDPQTFGEKLYNDLNCYDKRLSLDHKVLIMNLLSRVMGAHKLCVLSFYTYIIKYLTYHQLRVTSILVCLAQSVHELTPPDVLTPVVRKLAQEFVHPGGGPEVIAAGMNAIREVCRRQAWCMEEDLLGDLIEYRKSKDKGVTMAARSLLQLFRDVNPGLLKRRERGKSASMGLQTGTKALPFGHTPDAALGIDGLELLEDHLERLRGETAGSEDDGEAGWKNWELESDSSDSSESEGWIDVDSDGDEDIAVSDSDDEGTSRGAGQSRKNPEDESGDDKPKADAPETAQSRVSNLATTKILTPADFAMLNDLRIQAATEQAQAGGGTSVKRKLATLEANQRALKSSGALDNTFVSENDILGPRKKPKADYAERMESIQKGRDGREKFGSLKGKKKKDAPSSSTNREKARNKPIMMILSSGAVKSKKKASLREKQKKLRAHVEKSKKMKH